MSQKGPHISIASERLLPRVLGLKPEEVAAWPEDVQDLALGFASEMFLVRYNPFIDPELVKKSVRERFEKARHSLSRDYVDALSGRIESYFAEYDADALFRRELIGRLNQLLPPDCVILSPGSLVECSTDATDLRMELPLLVVAPENGRQVQTVVRLAGEMGFSLVPRGGGTGLTGGAVPTARRTVILSLSRLKKIAALDPEAKILCAEAGVLTLNAIKAAEEQNLLFTVDPASKAGSSIGGNISENSGGPFAFEYGVTLDNILSFKMVTPGGEMIEVRRKDHPRRKIFEADTVVFEVVGENGKVRETLSLKGEQLRGKDLGKDVTDKYLGGLPGVQKEGVDGVIVEGCFVLHDKPAFSRVLCLEFFGRSMRNASLVIKDVVRLRDRIREEGDLVKISALEEFNAKYVQAIEYKKKSARYEGDPISVLIMQLDSDDEAALEEAARRVMDIVEPYENVDVFAASDKKEAERFWEDRHKLSAISKRTSGFKVNEDVVIPIERIPDFSDFLEDLNLHFMARVYRKALKKADELTEQPGRGLIDDEFIESELDFTAKILRGGVSAKELSDSELEIQTSYFFRDLRSRYSDLADKLNGLETEMRAKRIIVANHMHAGDGNCHVNIPVNSNDPEMLAQAHEAAEMVFRKVLELKGGVSGEHGIGITKIAFLSEDKLKALREYKKRVDPKGILNPAKLTTRDLTVEPYTFSFNRLIRDLRNTALPGKERLIKFLTDVQTCNRCGKCKQVCAMYYPQRGLMHHPRNKNISLGALIEAIYYSQIHHGEPARALLDELRRMVEHCTACGKCMSVCPNKINTPEVTLHMRAFLEEKGVGGHPIKSGILHALSIDPAGRLPMAAKVMSLGETLQRSAVGLVPASWRARVANPLFHGPGPRIGYANLAETLDLKGGSLFIPEGGREWRGETVFYFPGCGAGLFYRSIGLASVWLMLKAGAAVVVPPRHMCCGYPLLVSGCEAAFEANRERNVEATLTLLASAKAAGADVSTVITSCGSCREGLSHYDLPRRLLDPLAHQDVLQFLVGRIPRLDGSGLGDGGLLYHASCHAEWAGLPAAKAAETYRAALARLVGVDVALSPGCCGESGLGAMTSPAIYNKIRERKQGQLSKDLDGYAEGRPIVVGCPSCKIGIKRSLLLMDRDAAEKRPVLHAMEWLARLVGGEKWKKNAKRALSKAKADAHGLRRVSVEPL